ncbi:RNA polymerase sigma factor [Bacillus sp. FJAT-27251]|uniref:RNA polymerase sigma factor n=1 Tax=Bacillus sp. FJAT-27251 TaxID=1684142 RepID=UPI0006A7CC78|nr:RNA polymerase sigma factor [Bacillus sp. FJAT-27251]
MENTINFEEIYTIFHKRLLHTCYAIIKDWQLAEDIVQETFIKAYKKSTDIQENGKVGAWLSTIAVRTAIDFLRKQKRNMAVPIEQGIMEALTTHSLESVEQEVEAIMLKEKIRQSFQELTLEQQKVFHLKVECGLKEAEIASLLDVKPSTVKTRFYRARNQLKLIVGELDIA